MTHSIQWAVTTQGDPHTTLSQWANRLQNPQPAFNEMADALAVVQKEWFRTQGGGTWAPLSPRYAAWKRARFPKRGILHGPDRPGHRGLQLRDQLTKRPFGYERITRTELVIGSTLEYAAFHQRGEGRLPKREPIKPLDPKTIELLKRIIQTNIVGQTIGRG